MGDTDSALGNIPWFIYALVLFVVVEHHFPHDEIGSAKSRKSHAPDLQVLEDFGTREKVVSDMETGADDDEATNAIVEKAEQEAAGQMRRLEREMQDAGYSASEHSSGDGGLLRGAGLKVHDESVARALRSEEEEKKDLAEAKAAVEKGADSKAAKNLDKVLKGPGSAEDTKAAIHKAAEQAEKALEKVKFNVTVPCIGSLVKPCGDLVVGAKGLDIKTPFGTKHIPGVASLKPQVMGLEDWMTKNTALVCIIGVALWIGKTCCIKRNREKALKSVRTIVSGNIDEDSDNSETEEEKQAELKKKMDPSGPEFIAPGNIYRLLAVLHPGKIGYGSWWKYAMKAGICCYMQLYLPSKILRHTLTEWQLLGIKSPLWFAKNAGTFATMVAALLSLCNMFAGKCGKNIMDGAEANHFIMSHKEPEGAADATKKKDGYESLIPFPPILIKVNQDFWCVLSMTVNVLMSFLLQFVMFVKVATFTGRIDNVAVVAVSLYFIFDLDNKVFDADPELRKRYRRAVLKQTEKTEPPKCVMIFAQTSKAFLATCVPFGLLGIVLLSWKNLETGVIIGGDGITRT